MASERELTCFLATRYEHPTPTPYLRRSHRLKVAQQAEKDRMDCFNKFIYIARRNVMHSAPVPQSSPDGYQAQIMDVGTGTGIWAIDMAE